MKKMVTILLSAFIILLLLFIYIFFILKAPQQKEILWGVNFSKMQSQALTLDWKKNYLALLEDLHTKHIKLIVDWDQVERKEGVYDFSDVDWQVTQAKSHGASIMYVMGMKSGRWPECHVPDWANSLLQQEQQDNILAYLSETVARYKNNNAITAWQVENEPLFKFGECPWYDKDFLIKEVNLVKSLDPKRPIIVSDSGEQSLWINAAKIGDVVGVTIYRTVWVHMTHAIGFYFTFPIPPVTYWYKSQIIRYLFHKEVISVELQAEPWTSKLFYDVPLREQDKTMNIDKFKENIQYAKKTGLRGFYLWGAEWWYWLKETQHRPEIWNEAKNLFAE